MNRLTVAVTTVQVPHVFKQFFNMAACLAICDHALTRQCHYYLTEFATAYVVVAVKGKKIENHIITDFVTGSTVHVKSNDELFKLYICFSFFLQVSVELIEKSLGP